MSWEGAVTIVKGLRGVRCDGPLSLVCERCHYVVDTDAVEVTWWAEAQHGFVTIQVNAMVTGACPNCL